MSDPQERELYKVNPVHDAQERALAAETICQDILSSSRNRLYLNMRFMDWECILWEQMAWLCIISQKS